jgi:uncharacterized protein YggT (Ycf19 family)
MELIFYFLAKVIDLILGLVSFAMIGRMLLPFFCREDNKILLFCAALSEPFVIPFRFLFAKFNIAENLPIDLSFTAAYMVIVLLRMFLPVI